MFVLAWRDEGGRMPRMARIVIPDLAHHVTRPGHRHQDLLGPARAAARKRD